MIDLNSKPIDSFKYKYSFLSNFYPVTIEYEGLIYRSSEAAYQASKTKDPEIRKEFTTYSASKSKREGNTILKDKKLWYPKSLKIMEDILRIKFSQDYFKKLLLDTGNRELIEGNTWHDNFFGSCICDRCRNIGENNLGKILMKIRTELRGQK
jgi:ribA/ribD-fused uncharacterized protein